MKDYDLLVVGGGINGCGVAARAAAMGYRVALCEQHDLGSHTSSASSKMVHGGLRYLEQGRFGLVAESLRERSALQTLAPHLVRPLPLVLPVGDGTRPLWMLRIGLLFYDWLSRKGRLPRSQALDLTDKHYPLRPDYRRGIRYWDCQVDDARLVLSNALAAQQHGADIYTYTRASAASAVAGGWQVTLAPQHAAPFSVSCKALINVAGPWVNSVDAFAAPDRKLPQVRLVKGSHLVLNRIYPGDDAFLLQHTDGRVVFCIPWLQHYTLFGTTDVDYHGEPADVAIDANEISYLKAVYQGYFGRDINDGDIVSTYSGVRALVDDGTVDPRKASRESRVQVTQVDGSTLVSLYGGKLTTYRALAEQCLQAVTVKLPAPRAATPEPLPGGDFDSLPVLYDRLHDQYPWLPDALLRRFAHSYGSRAFSLLVDCQQITDLGEDIGHGLYSREVAWLQRHEWARTAEDILWRRSKLGLLFSEAETRRLEDLLQ